MTEHFVEVSHVRKVYGSGAQALEAVGNVTFTVGRSEFVSLLGPSGCGKSTLLMMLAGLEPVTAGLVKVHGAPITGPRTEIGVMFQDAILLPWKTVLENVLYPTRILKLPVRPARERALELLDMVDLLEFRNAYPEHLSGGMRQRVAICRALVYDPTLLLMDEPFGALDAITRQEMNDRLLEIWERVDKCAVFVTHSIPEAVLLSDRVLVMNRRPSRIVADMPIPFPRPRPSEAVDSPEFGAIAAELRRLIKAGHADSRARSGGGGAPAAEAR